MLDLFMLDLSFLGNKPVFQRAQDESGGVSGGDPWPIEPFSSTSFGRWYNRRAKGTDTH
jgi:hypothetical protein